MRINYNVSAMISNNALSNSDSKLSASIQRLSSGLVINSAKDNPAGLAMAKRMNAQIEGLSKASQNASDGISIIETADGALSEVHDMLQRMNELAVKASNGPLSNSDRATIEEEFAQLQDEITRIAETTQFNSQPLLNGEFDLKAYTSDINVKVFDYSDEVATTTYFIDKLDIKYDGEGNWTSATIDRTTPAPTGTKELPADAQVTAVEGDKVTITGSDGFEITLSVKQTTGNTTSVTDPLTSEVTETTTTLDDLQLDMTGIGAMRLQIGANEGQVLAVRIPTISLDSLGLNGVDVLTEESATEAIDSVDAAIKVVSSIRSRLGAYQNRLESTTDSLDITSENMTAAYSRIMDVDMAEEMTQYSTYQVLSQAGTSMLAQANERPSQVLQLLQ